MAKKKSTSKQHGSTQARKRARNQIATPAEILQATVFMIRDHAKTRPPNCVIGDTPSETIQTCVGILNCAVAQANADISIVDRNVLRTVVDALQHAGGEALSLWKAAKGMAEAANG